MVVPHGASREEQITFDEKLHDELVAFLGRPRVHAIFSRYRRRTVFWRIQATEEEVERIKGFQGVRQG